MSAMETPQMTTNYHNMNGDSENIMDENKKGKDFDLSDGSSDLLRHATTMASHSSVPSRSDPLALEKTVSIAHQMSLPKEIAFVALLCSAQFTTQLGLVNTLSILHVIGSDLNITNPGVLSWLIAGYSLTVGSFILISGRFGDMFGYKRMLIIGYSWFALWSLVSGLSVYVGGKNGGSVLFIWARVLSGIGPAINMPNAVALLGVSYPPGPRKNMVFSLFGACAPSGAVVGGAFAGLWSLLWWPWAFWSCAIAMIGLALLSVWILPHVPLKPEIQNLTFKEKMKELDLVGATVGVTALILVNFAINQAPGFGWHYSYIYVLLILGLLMFPVFFWVEIKVAIMPLIPLDALSTDVSFVLGCIACGWASFGIWIYYYYQFLEVLRSQTPLLTVAQFSPAAISGLIAAVTTGQVIGRLGPGWVMFASMIAFLVGSILLATAPIHQTYWAAIFMATIIMPWGMDMSFPAGTLILSDAVSKEHQGVAASLVNTVVNYSISIGVGLAGTVEVHINPTGTGKVELLKGYRSALYLAVGLSALGVVVAALFLLKTYIRERRVDSKEDEGWMSEKAA